MLAEEFTHYLGSLPGDLYVYTSRYELLFRHTEQAGEMIPYSMLIRQRGVGVQRNGHGQVILSVTSSRLGLNFVFVVRSRVFYREMYDSSRLILLLIGLLLVMLSVLFLWLTRANYRPIQRLTADITGREIADIRSDELSLIRSYYHRTVEEAEQLNIQLTELTPLVIEHLALRMAYGQITSPEVFRSLTRYAGVNLSGNHYAAMCLMVSGDDGSDSLETIETPVNVHCALTLPASFSDEDGNTYTEMPKNLSESITLTRTNGSGEPSESGDPSGTCEHVYGEWVVTKEATCTEAGSREKTCTSCGYKVTEEIPAAGHKWNSDYTVDRNPTAAAEGSKSKHCSVCNEIDPDSVQVIPKLTGTWKSNSKGWWYSWSDGSYSKSTFENIGGKTYYFDSDGYMVTGWQKIGGAWYYFSTGGAMTTGWQKINEKWYYMNESGVMQTAWQKIGGTWYYFEGSGAMVTGWQKIGNVWYYFSAGGAMVTGWQQIGGKWYYFEGSGAMAANKWVGNYYLTGSGAMATNTWIGQYYVGSDGKWIPGYGT